MFSPDLKERGFYFMPFGIRLLILFGIVAFIIGIFVVIGIVFKNKPVFSNKFIAKTAVFSALSVILYCVPVFKFSLPIFPSFLEIHFDEVPAFIAGFAYGPISGLTVILVKTIVKLPLTSTACVGELADLLYSAAFIVPAALIYKKNRSIPGAILSLSAATLIQVAVASLFTTFVMLDVYVILMPFLTKEIILGMCNKINPLINNLTWDFLLWVGIPFNAIKDAIVVLITLLLYKRLHVLIDRVSTKKRG